MSKKLVLVNLYGWGIGDKSKADAIANSKTPFYDHLLKTYPHSELLTDGENVGLPQGQMGNSEVGHLNIGAGRIVYQDLVKINKAVREKTIDKNPVLLEALEYAKQNIFKKFYRVGNEDTRKTKGTGLGLYIVKYLVEKHGGNIFVKNNSPRGTIFEVTL